MKPVKILALRINIDIKLFLPMNLEYKNNTFTLKVKQILQGLKKKASYEFAEKVKLDCIRKK